jgi:hypothetical protein
MKKISFKKISFLLVIVLVLFISAISPVSFSRAEDDDEEDNDRFWFLGREEREEDEWEDDKEEWEDDEGEDEDEEEWEERGDENIPQTPAIINTTNNASTLATLVDSDQDGIVDSADTHPGEDDYAYLLLDKNKNGVSDNLEILLK